MTTDKAHPDRPARSTDASPIAELARRQDPERFLATLAAPVDRREHLFTILAFEHEIARVRETVREPMIGEIRLQWWADALDRIAAGNPAPAHVVAQAVERAVRETALDARALGAMVEGRRYDLDDAPPPTMDDLVSYCDTTGGGVARAMLSVVAPGNGDAMRAASLVGTAWALTGILRALPHGQGRRRLFLPADRMAAAGLTVETVRPGGSLSAVARDIAQAARARLAEARRIAVPKAALPAVLPARLADAHLRRLARVGHDPFAPAFQRPDGWRAARIAIAAWTGRW